MSGSAWHFSPLPAFALAAARVNFQTCRLKVSPVRVNEQEILKSKGSHSRVLLNVLFFFF